MDSTTPKSLLDLYKKKTKQIGTCEKSNILFIAYYMKISINENDIMYERNIKKLNLWAEKLSLIFSKEEIDQMKGPNFDKTKLYGKIRNEFYSYTTEIWLIGPDQSGKSSIISLIPGVNPCYFHDKSLYHTRSFFCTVSKMKEINRKIKWKDIKKSIPLRNRLGLFFLNNARNIFIVLDSAKICNDKKQIDSLINNLEKVAPSAKVIIIANKQDLPNVKSPKEIEKMFDYPTFGFSAIESDAVKNFQKIVHNFFEIDKSDLPPHEQDVIDNFDFKLHPVYADYSDQEEYEKSWEQQCRRFGFKNPRPISDDIIHSYISSFIENKLAVLNNVYLVNKGHVRALKINGDVKEHKKQKFSRTMKLPDNLGNLSELQKMKITYTNLESLPNSIGNMKKLFFLSLSNNNLKSLPESIGNLVNLRSLWINNNKLVSLPDSIGNLSKLNDVYLMYNKITRMPESFRNLKCKDLCLFKNPLINLSNINIEELGSYSFTVNNLSQKGKALLSPIDYDGSVSDDVDVDEHKRTIRNLEPVAKYYAKSPIVLAEQYYDDPNSLTAGELERLIWEATSVEREFLESNLSLDNEILKKINERLSVNLNEKYKIIL